MESISDHQLQASLPEILERVGQGEQFTIIKDGQAVASLAPPPRRTSAEPSKMDVKTAIEKLIEFQKRGPTLGDGLTIRQLIDEGRR